MGSKSSVVELDALFAEIADGAAERERTRTLPFEQVRELAQAGFGALRLPIEHGGQGVSVTEALELVTSLARADPNIAQIFRGHFAFVERLLQCPPPNAELWRERIASGEIVGNAQSELWEATETRATLRRDSDGWLLDGTKYYTTGTIFADWTWTSAVADDRTLSIVAPARGSGVDVYDDWDGFGQRLTGSGTTLFRNTRISDDDVLGDGDPAWLAADIRVFFHLYLQAIMVGIGLSAQDDAVAFVRSRTRAYGVPGQSFPRDDPAVQLVVGDIASLVYAARSALRDAVGRLDSVRRLRRERTPARYAEVQIAQFMAQQIAVRNIMDAANRLFEVGGASETSAHLGLDRHWRNARTIASHNPAVYRQRAIGDYLLNGTIPTNTPAGGHAR